MYQGRILLLRILGKQFTDYARPAIPCAFCHADMNINSLEHKESAESIKERSDENWEPDWVEGVFSAMATCVQCRESCAIAGDMTYRAVDNEEGQTIDYEPRYAIKFIHPGVLLLDLPSGITTQFREAIEAISDVIWVNPDAAANRIRVSIDLLLSLLKVPRTRIRNHRREIIETHRRIDKFREKNPKAADYLEAVKWIGNDGSHEMGLTLNDVLDGLALLQFAINTIYVDTDVKLHRRMRQINSRKTAKIKPKPPF